MTDKETRDEGLIYQFGKAGLDGTNIQVSSFPLAGHVETEEELAIANRFNEDGLTGAKKESESL